MLTALDDAHAKRWREWQLKNEHEDRKAARRARLVFMTLFLAVGLWAGSAMVSRLG